MSLRVQTEKWKHLDVFEQYLLLGPSRTLSELSRVTGIHKRQLQNWSTSFNWPERLNKRDQRTLMAIEAENDKLYKDSIKKRHQQAYQSLAEKSIKFIEHKASSFARSKTGMRDAAIALDIAVKGERDILGLRDTKVKGALVKEGFAALIEMVCPA